MFIVVKNFMDGKTSVFPITHTLGTSIGFICGDSADTTKFIEMDGWIAVETNENLEEPVDGGYNIPIYKHIIYKRNPGTDIEEKREIMWEVKPVMIMPGEVR